VQPTYESTYVKQAKSGGVLISDLPQARTMTEQDILDYMESIHKQYRASLLLKRPKKILVGKKRVKRVRFCAACGNKIEKYGTKYCSYECHKMSQRRAVRPSKEELAKLIWEMPTTKVAKQFGVSDKAIEKWCKDCDVEKPPRGYWAKVQAGKL
jgi:predicted nucleic acid-binding Zn ribbon protein